MSVRTLKKVFKNVAYEVSSFSLELRHLKRRNGQPTVRIFIPEVSRDLFSLTEFVSDSDVLWPRGALCWIKNRRDPLEISESNARGGLSEGQESILPIINWYSDMMSIKQRTLNGTCLGQTFLRSLREGIDLMGTVKKEALQSSHMLGRVVIVTSTRFIRDFLGQIVKLHGCDCEYLEEFPKPMMEQTWKEFDALFNESRFLEPLKRGMQRVPFMS